MAFASGSRIADFDTQADLSDSSTAIAIDGFSLSSDSLTFTNTVNAKTAALVFRCNYAVAPDINSTIVVFAQQLNIDPIDTGTADQSTPSLSYLHDAVASIPVLDSTGTQLSSFDIDLRNVKSGQEYQFYIWNRTGQIIPAGWSLFLTPKATGVNP